ncbi:MAG: 1-(5-phosphoribosyl)-5-[(5-phosphoribosylamino)methylideneamino]imidazole-4-carboxamide isomerase [Oscillospiraceae bacterium]|nr:1-(5-phosphoribosyl)-5-[(5-phosphoribosylamino)methylideneamino]imidazole-4-carboxamide isomerase [Oscillospiraceae bacterium]
MVILPAIDIKDGQCVRLRKGDFATTEKVAEDPLLTAQGFQAAGAEWVHMVDLDGALEGRRVNAGVFESIAKGTSLKVELGGGIRTMGDIAYYLERGIARLILGSVAIKQPQLVREAMQSFGPKHFAVGIDAKNRKAAAGGWLDVAEIDYIDLARRMEDAGVQTIVFTDISRDGMLSGPNLEQLEALQDAVSCGIIASGGIKDIGDIRDLAARKLYGAICGKSLYAGTLDLREAIQAGNCNT